VDNEQREQARLIALHETSLVERKIDKSLSSVFAEHSAAGRLQSGATIKVSVRAMQEIAEQFLSDLAIKIKAVAAGREAFDVLSEAVLDCLNLCGAQMQRIIRMARPRAPATGSDSVERAALQLFAQMRSDVETKLQIQKFDFEQAASGALAPDQPNEGTKKTNSGGRPPAAFWDDLWAAMAAALYDGSLSPKTQADIERAMADWLEAHSHTAAPSTVRTRARRLWDAITAINE
jgi:hypothetical protein